ncbi:bicaudal D-related protein 1-like isoform X1 [Sinocyclocheilus anshuiensis]|uniref:bicaudal D-related protein 1-like isoform X1 n=1 Tax=Sinocyclocheilus anshuiensis TaxID=1608454 RepID=UPI0007B9E801|nr:PREDICTED: bicaudal D-related protein 1-like isoform X1 [Sinocyclocheilus anshuiensis]
MSRAEELCYKAREMEVEEDFYSYELSNAEGLRVYKDSEELFAALRQKEDEVLLAAQVGKALLLENRQLKQETDALQDKHTQQLEELEQGRYELRVKLEDCRAQWESQVSELERDVQELQAQVERLKRSLSEAERGKSRLKQEHSEQSQRLREQLQRGMEVEHTMTGELQRLKEEMRERGQARPQDEEIINALREQVARLTQREQTLKQRLKMTCHENEELKDTVTALHARLDLQEQQSHTHIQQLAEAWREVDGVRSRAQELQSQVEELQEEVALQEKSHNDSSLLSELENNLDVADWSLDKEQQVCQELHYILKLLQPVAYRSEAEQDSDDSLQGMLGQLKHAAQWRSETLQEKRKSIVGSVSDPCENAIRIQELQDQNERLVAETAELKLRAERLVEQEVVQQAIKDRDDAIAKKTAMEAELLRTKHDMMCLNNQLLEAIQRKLELSQELEAWQDDIQVIINQQLRSQQQTEEPQKRSARRLSFLRKSRRPSTISETSSQQNQTPWRDWLKRSK